jgi:hypothetical protein
MINSLPISNAFPPHLSMDEYVDFVEASLRECNRIHATRQKEVEERIRSPFCFRGETEIRRAEERRSAEATARR